MSIPPATVRAAPRWRVPATALDPRARYTIAAFMAAGFGIGLTQTGAASVIQDQVVDLGTNVETIGITMVAYALGVVVGAPLIMVGMGRVNRRPLLIWLSAVFAVTTLATALAPNVESLMVIRFLSGFPHGALLGTAAFVATTVLGAKRRGLAVALIMIGLTSATIVGVPAMQWISNSFGWREAYYAVFVVGLLTLLGLWLFTPRIDGNPHASLGSELRSLRGAPLWTAVLATTIGFAGFAAVFSYIVPLMEDANGVDPSAVTWVLVVIGVGFTVGAVAGGRISSKSPVLAARVGLICVSVVLTLLGLFGTIAPLTIVIVVLLAVSIQIYSQSAQTHLMDVIHTSPSLGNATSHAALNAANALGAGMGALVIWLGWGYVAPAWVALGLTLVALVMVFRGAGYRTPQS